jgi:hypothetical protein
LIEQIKGGNEVWGETSEWIFVSKGLMVTPGSSDSLATFEVFEIFLFTIVNQICGVMTRPVI